MGRVAMLVLVVPALAACSTSKPPPTVVTVDATVPRPALTVAAPSTPQADFCAADIYVTSITSDPLGCFLDVRVRDEAGELTFPCEGGDAQARFPHVYFRGRASGDVVDLTLQTTFDFVDGCRWTSEQNIRGSVSAGELDYAYTEAPAPGQSDCASACTARAKVTVRRRSAAAE